MNISPLLAADLKLLTEALDRPGTDIAETVIRLAAGAKAAVDSYLGLSVVFTANRSQFDFTVLDEGVEPGRVRTSLRVRLSSAVADAVTAPVALILYAATPGAFVDLAADLSWVTGACMGDFRVDENVTLPSNYPNPPDLGAASTINQALGVLIERGSTPEQAARDLYARAVTVGINPLGVATLILAALSPPKPEASGLVAESSTASSRRASG